MSGFWYRVLRPRRWCFQHYLLCIGLSLMLFSIVPQQGLAKTSIRPGAKAHLSGQTVMPQVSLPAPVTLPDLQADATKWETYADGGPNISTVANIGSPSFNGHALAVSLLSGTPYTGAHAYRELPGINATNFKLQLSFYIVDSVNLQGLEFTMDRWQGNQRFEWALQWEQFSDGTLQQGVPPTWRLWTGLSWQNIGITQSLSLSTWHTLTLAGDIFNGNVRYQRFSCDELSSPLPLVFPPVSSSGDKVVVGTQIDGNAHEDPAQVYLDNVSLSVQ